MRWLLQKAAGPALRLNPSSTFTRSSFLKPSLFLSVRRSVASMVPNVSQLPPPAYEILLYGRTHTDGISSTQLKDPSLLKQNVCYVDGQWVPAKSGKTFEVHDPATGEFIGTCPEFGKEDTEIAIETAYTAFESYRTKTGRERSKLLRRWYDLMLENHDDLATLITWENGKPAADAKGEVTYAANFLEWFSEEAPRIYGDTIPSSVAGNSNPEWVLVAPTPEAVTNTLTHDTAAHRWNYPAAMITRKVGPALAAGCTVVCKAPGETPFTSLAIAELADRAGIPKGVVNIITAMDNTPEVGGVMTSSPIVKKLSFTGSTNVGKLLMKQCSGTLKKLSMELGGNAPFIVFDDADIDAAVAGAIISKFRSSGQTCVCANRIFVQKGIYEEFATKFAEEVKTFKVGNGFKAGVTHGPLIHDRAVKKADSHVRDAESKGAKVIVGGHEHEAGTNFFAPTVLTGMTTDMAMSSEETFGPVAGLFPFETEDEVVKMANSTNVGLAGYFFSRDLHRVHRVSEHLEVGMVGVNTGLISDPAAPFGGVKESGFGKEGSHYGIGEYQVTKMITYGGMGKPLQGRNKLIVTNTHNVPVSPIGGFAPPEDGCFNTLYRGPGGKWPPSATIIYQIVLGRTAQALEGGSSEAASSPMNHANNGPPRTAGSPPRRPNVIDIKALRARGPLGRGGGGGAPAGAFTQNPSSNSGDGLARRGQPLIRRLGETRPPMTEHRPRPLAGPRAMDPSEYSNVIPYRPEDRDGPGEQELVGDPRRLGGRGKPGGGGGGRNRFRSDRYARRPPGEEEEEQDSRKVEALRPVDIEMEQTKQGLEEFQQELSAIDPELGASYKRRVKLTEERHKSLAKYREWRTEELSWEDGPEEVRKLEKEDAEVRRMDVDYEFKVLERQGNDEKEWWDYQEAKERGPMTAFNPSLTKDDLHGFMPSIATADGDGARESAMRNLLLLGGGQPYDRGGAMDAEDAALRLRLHRPLFFNTEEEKEWMMKVLHRGQKKYMKFGAGTHDKTKRAITDLSVKGEYEEPKHVGIDDAVGVAHMVHIQDGTYTKRHVDGFEGKLKSLLPQYREPGLPIGGKKKAGARTRA
ncbi:Glutarate-semialdehyde dehydrogenase DavD [Zalerion maritima]|uniref:Succinate-semialdehyde dehydrogenase, mitochondrial n=1 Tax=Zalerion maritima TaxID=339359 RepID=A0AAD5RWH5_9PEZI|nr:Glutarate-semialdehyde dehydrogenase DavD [Zalerion maritima]